MVGACPTCGCGRPEGAAAHAVLVALADDDLDRALALGLLDVDTCGGCDPACTTTVLAARETRERALAARERFHARESRLARRRLERNEQRIAVPSTGNVATAPAPLPAAAAAALARAKAKAADRR